ncbi:MAG: tetratricopeptide repeat protein [Limnochordales bacterium]
MTQADLAGSDFTKSFISQIEKNQTQPSLKSLMIIAQRLNRPVSYFLDEDPAPPAASASLHQAIAAGRLLERQGEYEQALQLYTRALDECAPTDYRGRGDLHRRRARTLMKLDRVPAALQALEQAADEFRLARDTAARAEVDCDLGSVYDRLGRYDQAVHHYERALLLYEEAVVPDPASYPTCSIIWLLTHLGLTCFAMGNREAAQRYLQRAEAMSQETQVYYRWGELCRVSATLMADSGDRRRALEYAERAVAFCDSTGDQRGLVDALISLGSLRAQEDGWAAAEPCFTRALRVAEEIAHHDGKARVQAALAKWAAAEGDLDRAVALYEEAAKSASDQQEAVEIHRSLADLLRARQEWEGAARHLETAIAFLEKANRPKALAEAYSALAEIYEAAGQAAAAHRCLRRSVELFRAQ